MLYHTTFQGLPERNKNLVAALVDVYFANARERLDKSEYIVLCQDHGALAGVLALCREPADEWTSRWRVDKFCVRENRRHAGIGTDMLEYALREVCGREAVAVHVDLAHHRFDELVSFYEKRGFQPDGDDLLHRTLVHKARI